MNSFAALSEGLSYDSVRHVKFRHTGLSLTFVFCCFMIAVYLLGYELALKGAHLDKRRVHGFAKFALAAPWYQNKRCFEEGCRTLFTPDVNLPYCERFIKLKEGDKVHEMTRSSKRKPCALYDVRDIESGLWDEDDTATIATRRVNIFERMACPEMLKPESGFGVNHSSYFCNSSTSWHGKETWDGYIIDPERFRVIILHSMMADMASHNDLFFVSNQMEGKYRKCHMEGKKEVCELKKIPCVHKKCGLSQDAIQAATKQENSSSSLSELAQGISDHKNNAAGVTRLRNSKSYLQKANVKSGLRNSQSSSKKAKVKVGVQSDQGFLEFLPNELSPNGSSRSVPGNISEDSATTQTTRSQETASSQDIHDAQTRLVKYTEKKKTQLKKFRTRVRKACPICAMKLDKQHKNVKPWNSLWANLDENLAKTLDLDTMIVQGKHGLITSIDFLLDMAGISSLDAEVPYSDGSGSFIPREQGINLQIVFEYLNWKRDTFTVVPSTIPSYTMQVKLAYPKRFNKRKRSPGDFRFNETTRQEYFMNGVHITSLHIGEYSTTDFGRFAIVGSSAVGLLAVVRFILDTIASYLLRSSKLFNKYKYEQTETWNSNIRLSTSSVIEGVRRFPSLLTKQERAAETSNNGEGITSAASNNDDDIPNKSIDMSIVRKMLSDAEAKLEAKMAATMEAKDLAISKLEAKIAQLEAGTAP